MLGCWHSLLKGNFAWPRERLSDHGEAAGPDSSLAYEKCPSCRVGEGTSRVATQEVCIIGCCSVGSSVAASGDVIPKVAGANRLTNEGKVGRIELAVLTGSKVSTSFNMWDLTICRQINATSRLLDTLQARLATLRLAPKNDLKALHSAVEQAQSAYNKAQSDLQKTYTSNIISLAQSFVSAANVFQYGAFVTQATKFNIVESAFTGIEAAMNKTTAAHEVVNSASRAYSQALSAVTLAEATDTAQEITAITLQMDAVRKEITA